MWVMAVFDLPTQTKIERKRYSEFRKTLLQQGFQMMQYSVYVRHVPTQHQAESLVKRIGPLTPQNGVCAFIFITDKQYGMTKNFYGAHLTPTDLIQKEEQFVLFEN